MKTACAGTFAQFGGNCARQIKVKNGGALGKRAEGRYAIEGIGKTIFDKK
jgi:hypothetical protein